MKKLLFIFNPRSGKELIRLRLLDILDLFIKQEYEVSVHVTQGQGDALSVVTQRADRFDLVICSGGDGTFNETVAGILSLEKKPPIGYIPAGTTNDFARSLEIPCHMREAAKCAMTGKPFACDIGSFNDDSFVYIASFGIFTEVSYSTKQEIKNVLGHMA